MKSHFTPCLTLSVALVVLGAFNLSAADWGSLHGNNRSAPPAYHQQSQPSRAPEMNGAPAPAMRPEAVRTPESHPAVQPQRERPQQDVRADNHGAARPVMDRTPDREVDRRRMDIDEDRRQSYYWSDYHSGMRVDRLPDGYRRFHIHDHDYFYFGGGPSGYEVCAPPVDADIPALPPGAEAIQVGDTVYYYAAGAFYVQQSDGSFIVVPTPLGVTVALLPPDATSVVVNGIGYFLADGVYYQPVMQGGVTAYLTIPAP